MTTKATRATDNRSHRPHHNSLNRNSVNNFHNIDSHSSSLFSSSTSNISDDGQYRVDNHSQSPDHPAAARTVSPTTTVNTPMYDPDDARYKLSLSPGRRVHCPKTGIIYELGEQIGSGAAAVVFKCKKILPAGNGLPERVDTKNEIAAKVMDLRGLRLRTDFQREREKLRREVSILSRLHHPCIVNLLHVIETKDELFLMMELVKGGELFYKIVDRGSLTEDQARYALLQVLSALEYMHGKGVIHRDLKPENILVASEPVSGFFRVKVADLGLAKLVLHGISEAKTFVGTPQYWAPEVIDSSTTMNHIYGPEADLWSLGCVIYVMLGGSYPFDTRREPIDTLIKNARFHFRYPRFERVSEDAKNLIRGLLTVDPKKRLTLNDILNHPWITSYKTPPGVPPLPILSPFESKDFDNSLNIATMSILGPTPSFNLNPSAILTTKMTPRAQQDGKVVPSLEADETMSLTLQESEAKKERKQVDEEHKKVASQIQNKQSQSQQYVERFEIDDRLDDPVSKLARQQTRATATAIPPFHHHDHPDDPNTRAIVPAYQPWRPNAYPPWSSIQQQYPPPPSTMHYPFAPYSNNAVPPQPQNAYWWYAQQGYPPPGYYNPSLAYQQQGIPQGWSPIPPPIPHQYNQQEQVHEQAPPPTPTDHSRRYWDSMIRQQQEGISDQSSCPTYFIQDVDHDESKMSPTQSQDNDGSTDSVPTPYATFLPMSVSEDSSSYSNRPEIVHPEDDSNRSSYRYESPPTSTTHGKSYGRKGKSASRGVRAKREETVRAAELIFNFDELLDLQIYIIRKFHWAYIALRRCPGTAKLLRESIREVQDVQDESIRVITQFETTCSSVLKVLPDLMLAVKERQPQLAIDLFEDIRLWVNGLKAVVEGHQNRLTTFMEHVAELVEGIRHIKITTDEKFLTAAANLSSICDDGQNDSIDNCCPRVRSVDSNKSAPAGNVQSGRAQSNGSSKASTTDATGVTNEETQGASPEMSKSDPADECIKMVLSGSKNGKSDEEHSGAECHSSKCLHHDHQCESSHPSNNNGFQEWYDCVRDTALGQLESLVGKAVEDMDVCPERDSCDGTEITRVANDLLDLLFISPGTWAEHQRALASRKCLKEDPHQQRRHSNSSCCVRRPCRPVFGNKDVFPQRTRSHSNPDSTRTGSSDDSDGERSMTSSSSMKHHHHHHKHHATTAPVTDGESERPQFCKEESLRHHRHWRQKETRQRRWRAQQQLYGHALKTSEILVRALEEVRRVDQILRQSAQFWINFTIIIDQLCKMKTHTERLLQYSTSNPEFAKRFFERLNDYRDFWTALRDQSHRYVVEARSKMRALNEFALAIESTADRADTANALHLGQSAAIMG